MMATALLLGLPLAAFLITYAVGRELGRGPVRVCVVLSSLPAGWGWFQFFFVHYRPLDPQVTSSEFAGKILLWTLSISCGSVLGMFLAGRHPSTGAAGTGLNP